MDSSFTTRVARSLGMLNLNYGVSSHVGLKRSENQDSYGIARSAVSDLFIVADGMGGAKGGATASFIAVKNIIEKSFNPNGEIEAQHLKNVVIETNSLIYSDSKKDFNLSGMGTTLASIGLNTSQVFVIHVGDSRIYALINDKVVKLTKDHTLVQELVETGALTEEEAARNPIHHVLTRSLGPLNSVEPTLTILDEEIKVGTKFLICSDGLYNHVSTEEIQAILAYNNAQQSVDLLVDLALKGGGSDNVTVQVIEVVEKNSPELKPRPLNSGELSSECSEFQSGPPKGQGAQNLENLALGDNALEGSRLGSPLIYSSAPHQIANNANDKTIDLEKKQTSTQSSSASSERVKLTKGPKIGLKKAVSILPFLTSLIVFVALVFFVSKGTAFFSGFNTAELVRERPVTNTTKEHHLIKLNDKEIADYLLFPDLLERFRTKEEKIGLKLALDVNIPKFNLQEQPSTSKQIQKISWEDENRRFDKLFGGENSVEEKPDSLKAPEIMTSVEIFQIIREKRTVRTKLQDLSILIELLNEDNRDGVTGAKIDLERKLNFLQKAYERLEHEISVVNSIKDFILTKSIDDLKMAQIFAAASPEVSLALEQSRAESILNNSLTKEKNLMLRESLSLYIEDTVPIMELKEDELSTHQDLVGTEISNTNKRIGIVRAFSLLSPRSRDRELKNRNEEFKALSVEYHNLNARVSNEVELKNMLKIGQIKAKLE